MFHASKSGLNLSNAASTITVSTASIIPIKKWYNTIDGIPTFIGNVPAIPISIAHASAAITVANHAAIPAAGYFPTIPFNPLKVYSPTNPQTIAMFNTFAPRAVMPPSPNINA